MPEGVLTEAWQETELGQLGSFSRGRGGTRADEDPNGLPCIRYGDLYTHHDCIVRSFASSISPSSASSYTPLQPGDVVFAGSGETFEDIGKAVAYCHDSPAYAGADTIIFRPGPRLLPQFAGYALNSDCANAHKSRMGQGSSVIHIGAKHLSRMRFRLPPVEQQKRVAEILSTIDEAIEQTEALIAKTQHIKAGLMHDLFTRGVTADGQLRPPREEAPQLYKESPLGWIPKEWELRTARDLCSVITKGTTPPATAFSTDDQSVRFLRVDNLSFNGELDLSVPPLFVDSRVHRDILRRSIIRPNDVLTNIVGPPLGKVAMVPEAENEWNANQAIAIFRAGDISADFLKSWLLTSHAQQWLAREAKQTSGQVNLTLKMCGDLPVPVPQSDEQKCMTSHLAGAAEALSTEAALLSKLRQQKLGLADDLIVGRVAVATTGP